MSGTVWPFVQAMSINCAAESRWIKHTSSQPSKRSVFFFFFSFSRSSRQMVGTFTCTVKSNSELLEGTWTPRPNIFFFFFSFFLPKSDLMTDFFHLSTDLSFSDHSLKKEHTKQLSHLSSLTQLSSECGCAAWLEEKKNGVIRDWWMESWALQLSTSISNTSFRINCPT